MAVDTEHANWRKNFKQNFRVLSNSKFYPVVCIFFFFFLREWFCSPAVLILVCLLKC